jgi:hypothetical protein
VLVQGQASRLQLTRPAMSNPYAAPSRSSDAQARVRPGASPATKPLRIWIFQPLLGLHFAGAVAITVSFLLSPAVRALPTSAILLGFIRPVSVILVVAALLAALQRLGPRPPVVAPVLVSIWWLVSISSHFALEAPPDPDALRSLTLDDVLSLPPWAIGIVLHAGLLWFVLSIWRHDATRAYLSRRALSKH